jgi:hypothetical protein
MEMIGIAVAVVIAVSANGYQRRKTISDKTCHPASTIFC